MLQERLSLIEKAVAAAAREPAKARQWVGPSIVKEMLMHEDNLSMVLVPFLHGKRFVFPWHPCSSSHADNKHDLAAL